MKLTNISLLFVFFVGLLSFIFGDDLTGVTVNFMSYDTIDHHWHTHEFNFGIDLTSWGIAGLTLVMAGVTLVGIQFLGSGLSPATVRVITLLVFYVAIWIMGSILAWDLIFLNVVVGTMIYSFLCVGYIIGVINSIGGSES